MTDQYSRGDVLAGLGTVLAIDAMQIESEPSQARRGLLQQHLAAHAVALLQMSAEAQRLRVEVRLDDAGQVVIVCHVSAEL